MITRRMLLVAYALGAIAPARTFAQARPARVGILHPFPLADPPHLGPLLLQRLAELGYKRGAGMVLEYRSADGFAERFPKLARELLELKCDVIFALGPEHSARPFRDTRSAVPVVVLAIDYDPLEKGIVANLRRPGGNITGVYIPQIALAAKRLEIAQEVFPGASRFLVLGDVYTRDQLAALRKAAEARKARLTVVEFAQPPYDYAGAFETGRQAGVEVFIGMASPVLAADRSKLAALLASQRLPAVGIRDTHAEAGFLLSYGADVNKAAMRAADIGVRILKGANPADIPVEQSTEFELVINLRTAKSLGVKIPYSVLARATRLIE